MSEIVSNLDKADLVKNFHKQVAMAHPNVKPEDIEVKVKLDDDTIVDFKQLIMKFKLES